MPKSKVRTKAVYTPPARATKSKASPRWVVPAMLVCLLLGLAWIALFYVTGGDLPFQSPIGNWNLAAGFALIIGGVMLSTRWR